MAHRLLPGLGVLVVLLLASAVEAQDVTFEFTGVISRVGDAFAGGPFEIGQAVSGSYTFDASAADQDSSSVVGLYETVLRFECSVPAAGYNGLGEAGSKPGTILLLDDQDGVRDRYSVFVQTPDQVVTGPAVGAATLQGISLVLRDTTTFALSSDALPLSPPLLEDFGSGTEVEMRFFHPCDPGGGPCGDVLVSADLTTLTLSSVVSLLDDLIQHVIALNLQRGISNSFDAKLEAVMRAIDDSNENNDVAAENAMYAFIHAVEAQRNKSLTDAQADQLVGIAQAVIAALGG